LFFVLERVREAVNMSDCRCQRGILPCHRGGFVGEVIYGAQFGVWGIGYKCERSREASVAEASSVGSRFPMLESKKAWEGTASFKGGRENLQKAIAEATKTAKKYIEQQLPVGTIRNLCHHLLTETNTWLKDLIEHICKELQTVTQYGIPEKNTYTLVCDELQLIFDALWDKRMCMQEFATEQDHQLYFARSIFITMEAHMVMADFKSTDFANHVLITSLFVRFLAEQTGQNFSAGLNSTLASIRDDVEKNEKKNERAHKAINSRLDNHTENIKGLAGKSEFKYVPWKPSAGTTG
jgi:hypothetical protein